MSKTTHMADAIEYVQARLGVARIEFGRDNEQAAIDEIRKAAARLEEAIDEELRAA